MNSLDTDVVLGIDTSLYDYLLNVPLLKEAGVKTVVVKLGSGGVVDPKFYKNAEAVANGGLNLQAYYWDDIIVDPLHQVDWATNEIRKCGFPVTFAWVDVEQWWTDWTLWLQARRGLIPYSSVPRATPDNISSHYEAFMAAFNKNIPGKVGSYSNWGFIGSWAPKIVNWIGKYNLWNPLYANQPPYLGYEIEWAELKEKWLPKEWPATCPGTTPEQVVGYQWTGDAFKMPGVYDELGRKMVIDINLFKKSFMQSIKDPITFPGVPVPVVPPPPPVSDVGKYVVNVNALNIRKGPSTDYPLAGNAMPNKTVVDVVKIEGKWAKLISGAYCYLEYLTSMVPSKEVFAGTKYTVSSLGLNIRKGPGVDYETAGPAMAKGGICYVIGTDGDWAKLTSGSWCYLPYLARAA